MRCQGVEAVIGAWPDVEFCNPTLFPDPKRIVNNLIPEHFNASGVDERRWKAR